MRKFVVEWVQRAKFEVMAQDEARARHAVNTMMDDNAIILIDENSGISYLEGYDAVESVMEG